MESKEIFDFFLLVLIVNFDFLLKLNFNICNLNDIILRVLLLMGE